MAQYSMSYTQDLAKEGSDEKAKRPVASGSVVKVIHVEGKRVVRQVFTGYLSTTMSVSFGCGDYRRVTLNSVGFNFCGIAPNTAAAAVAFEMCSNLISH